MESTRSYVSSCSKVLISPTIISIFWIPRFLQNTQQVKEPYMNRVLAYLIELEKCLIRMKWENYTYRHFSSINAFCVFELHRPVILQLLYLRAMYKDKDPQPHPTSRTLCPSSTLALSQYRANIASSASSKLFESFEK